MKGVPCWTAFLTLLLVLGGCAGEKDYFGEESPEAFEERMEWWRDARFGMFIHWGPYAQLAGAYQGKQVPGIGEWIMQRASIPVDAYENMARQFNPRDFDATEWVRIAKDAGMKYIVITSKHHDGFALWNSNVSTYDFIDHTEFGRDALMELSEACKAAGIKLGFYHSIMDWHHPQAQAPFYPDYNDREKSNAEFDQYVQTYLKPQVKELIETYDPAILWFDGEWVSDWNHEYGVEMYNFVRNLKPDILVNNRVDVGRQGMQGMNKADQRYAGDFGTPEQEILEGTSSLDWEACMTMNDTWGYKSYDHNWKSAQTLIHNLIDVVAKGGNYLLNVGPTPEGRIPGPSVERLVEMGEWLKVNGEAIYGTRLWDTYAEGDSIRYTHPEGSNKVYAITLSWPGSTLNLHHIQPTPGTEIYLLGHAQPLTWVMDPGEGLIIRIPESLQAPGNRPCKYAYAFQMEGTYAAAAEPVSFMIGGDSVAGEYVLTDPVQVALSTPTPEGRIYYTLDGSHPNRQSSVYQGPISVSMDQVIKAVANRQGLVNSRETQLSLWKSPFASLVLTHPPQEPFASNGPLALADTQTGSQNPSDGHWQGFLQNDLEAVVDLGEVQFLRNVRIRFLNDPALKIFLPRTLAVSISRDGTEFKEIHRWTPEKESLARQGIYPFEKSFTLRRARYVKIQAENIRLCPDGHPEAGTPAWVMADEININD